MTIVAECEPWPVEWCAGLPEGSTPEQQDDAVAAASWVLRALSGYQFGRCKRRLTVQAADVCHTWPTQMSWIVPPGAPPCCVIEVGPNATVEQVTIDGTALTPVVDYYVQGRYLVKGDGTCWPTADVCDPPRTIIDLTTGADPPPLAAQAVGELAAQLLIACTGEGTCVLPSRVVAVNRQGISMNLLDPLDYTRNGKLGLAICDTFLMAVNPDHLSRNSAVLSPDTRRRVWL